MDTKEIFKDFLRNNQYHVMHETDISNSNIEHFFVFFQLKDIINLSAKSKKERNHQEVEVIITYLDSFQNNSIMQNLSLPTIEFIKKQKEKLIYIPLISLDNTHHFYLKRKKEIEDNYENFLSLKMIGEPADPHKHLNMQIDSKISDIKDISLGVTSLAKDIIQEKTPILKKNILDLGNKLGNKIKSFKK